MADTAHLLNETVKPAGNAADVFRKDVLDGLGTTPKKLPSKYFYDTEGDRLFQEIMAMPDYYLTGCELDIFKNKSAELAEMLTPGGAFDLIELGAGDALKSTWLLKHLHEQGITFTYMPIDISANILGVLKENLKDKLPVLTVTTLQGDYFEALERAYVLSSNRKVIMFLGSNIGNMELDEAYNFCTELRSRMGAGDVLLMGFDLKKNPRTILNAYNDAAGITAKFNLNYLTRINRELDGNINPRHFSHYQMYNPLTGACRSFLVSTCNQKATVAGREIEFLQDEVIDMEVSQKFSVQDIENLAMATGFQSAGIVYDSRGWFADVVWRPE